MSNLLFDSRYPADKIVWFEEIDISNSSPYWVSPPLEFRHIEYPITGLQDTKKLLLDGVFTTDNWQTSDPIDQYYTRSNTYVECMPSDIQGNIWIRPVTGGVGRLKLWAYYPEDYYGTSTMNTSLLQRSNFQRDSRLNYPKLISEIRLTATNSLQVYRHNLGYKPIIKMWDNDMAIFWGKDYGLVPNGLNAIVTKVTNTTFEYKLSPDVSELQNIDFLVRIYADKIE